MLCWRLTGFARRRTQIAQTFSSGIRPHPLELRAWLRG